MAKKTIAFSERVKGFPTFYSFLPDWMKSLNNNFYSVKDGQLYIHNSENVPHNTFYGVQYASTVGLMVNESPSDIKELQAISLEGNYSWNALITAYVSMTDDFIQSTIDEVEFVKKEGIWYAYARRNEDTTSFDSKSTYGIGEITDITSNTITVNGHSKILTFGDSVARGADLGIGGTVVTNSFDYETGLTTIELSAVAGLIVGDFVFGMKHARTEGGNLRGYTMRVDLDITKDDKVELFVVNSEIMKSFS